MVSRDKFRNDDSELPIDDISSLSYCNDLSLDLNTSSTKNSLHDCDDSPCISCKSCLSKPHNDMFVMSCSHDQNACISSSCCTNNVGEIQSSVEPDADLNIASSHVSSSLTIFCLTAKSSKNDGG